MQRECSKSEMQQELSQVWEIKKEIDELPKESSMVKMMDMLVGSEKKLVGKTTFFAIKTIQGMVFLVRPNDMIPSTASLIRTKETNEPVRQSATSSG
jgi:hypothetical protein